MDTFINILGWIFLGVLGIYGFFFLLVVGNSNNKKEELGEVENAKIDDE